MNTEIKLKVSEIQRFCMHDGPGVRTTVFLKGCPLRCAWCHNPETQSSSSELLFYANRCIGCSSCVGVCESGAHTENGKHSVDREKCVSCGACEAACPTGASELCGKDISVGEILSVIEKDSAFYGSLGGVTLSGGEPFMQKDNTLALIRACKENGLSVAVETCGYADPDVIRQTVPYVDIFLWDIKDTDCERHKRYTGVKNGLILENLSLANEMGAKIRLRCILVSGVNTDEGHYLKIAELAGGIKNLDGVELIPYHAYGGAKAALIGGEDNGKREWIPEASELERARLIIKSRGIPVL